jgi:hypothetical protein
MPNTGERGGIAGRLNAKEVIQAVEETGVENRASIGEHGREEPTAKRSSTESAALPSAANQANTCTEGSNPSATQSGTQRSSRNFANLAHPPDWRKCPAFPLRQALRPVSLKDRSAVRFQKLQQARAMWSQTDDSAKAGLTFSFSTQWELVSR